jgi:hypothetical protein
MAVPSREPSLSDEQRHALALLATFPHGIPEDRLALVHGFDRAMIARLVHEGLAMVQRETIEAGGRTIEVVCLIITVAGRRALEG